MKFPGFRLKLTRWGGIFLLALLVLGFAAVNTGNNALMALLGVALGSYVVSGAWSRQVLGGVEVRARVQRDVFAGRPALVEVELTNSSRLFPAYGIVVRDGSGRLLTHDRLLPTAATRRHTIEVEFEHRGWQDVGPWQVEVLLPLGFFLKSKELLRGERILVYPRLLRASTAPAHLGGGRRSADVLEGRGREGDVVQLREFREGDDRRQLHWKQTARQQRLIVVDRQRRAERPIVLVVDPRVENPKDPATRRRFERMISDVATGVVRRLERGEAVGLVVGHTSVAPVLSPRSVGRLLRPLAEVEPMAMGEEPPAVSGSEPKFTYRAEAMAR
jgi:uncharacterized protein (DUF58 family)